MKSILGALLNRAPVPIGGRDTVFAPVEGNVARSMELHLTAMEAQSTLFAIIDRLATSVAATEWSLWRGERNLAKHEGGTQVFRHPALLVWNKPNPFFTRTELVETVQQYFELVGEKWLLPVRSELLNGGGPPVELWAVRPDRMHIIPSQRDFIAGYEYGTGRDKIPLRLDQVIYNKRPNPLDAYRGLGPIGSLLLDIEGETAATEWNTRFFRQGAEPGGVIEIPEGLSEQEFEALNERWNQQHKGVRNAHRVAIIEKGVWKDRRFTFRDMQFEQLRRFSRETFRQAYGFPKPLLGDVEDVNRANAEAAEIVFARWLQVPRLNRWRTLLNDDFLPMFGSMGSGFVFDYENPIPQLAAVEETVPAGPAEPSEVAVEVKAIMRELKSLKALIEDTDADGSGSTLSAT